MYRSMTQLKALTIDIADIPTADEAERKGEKKAPQSKGKGNIVTMSNALTRASHGLSLSEKRIIMMSISQLDSRQKTPQADPFNPDASGPVSTIYATDYADQYGLHLTTAYEQLAEAAKVLFERKITFYTEASFRQGVALDSTKRQLRWVGGVHYKDGGVTLAWNWEIIPHLIGLKKQFTSYQLEQASALRSAYSWKLLELLMRFKKSGWAEYDVEDFAESMGATEKQRENFNNIRRRIIEPAVKELCQKDGWIIEWKPSKKIGRRVVRLRFEFRKDDQLQLEV